MTIDLTTVLAAGGAGAVLAQGARYAIERAADAYRERAKKRAQTESDDAKSRREREEAGGAVAFIATEELVRTLREMGPRLDRAEKRLDACESRERTCQESLAAEREARRSDIEAARRECEEQIRVLRHSLRATQRSVNSLSPPRGVPVIDDSQRVDLPAEDEV